MKGEAFRKDPMRALALLSLLIPVVSLAGEPAGTVLCERGKLLLSDDFNQPLVKEWKAAKGKWEISEGALKGSERKEDNHGAVVRRAVPFGNAIIQYSFKLDGAKGTSLSINDATGHLARFAANAASFSIRKDDHDHDGPDKAAVLGTAKQALKPGVWHTVVIEFYGNEMAARVDDFEVIRGANEALTTNKANIGLTVAGESVQFKDLRVWEASGKKGK